MATTRDDLGARLIRQANWSVWRRSSVRRDQTSFPVSLAVRNRRDAESDLNADEPGSFRTGMTLRRKAKAAESIESAEGYASLLLRHSYESVNQRDREIWPERIVLSRRERGERVCHVHLMFRGHSVWKRLIVFRDYLRTHPDVAAKYAELKLSLAGTLGHDRHGYMSAKSDFINRITEIAMRDQRPEPSAAG